MDHCTSRGRNSTRTESVVYIGQKIRHCVKHIHREHHQGADHMAKWEAEGDMNVIVEGFRTMKAWQTIRGKWDGSKNTCGNSGCGIPITAVDRKGGSQSATNLCI